MATAETVTGSPAPASDASEVDRRSGRFLGLDVGTRRIGVARAVEGVAVADHTLERAGTRKDLAALARLIAEHPDGVVVGLPPASPDPRRCSARMAREFARRLAEATERPTWLVDEAESTLAATERLQSLGYSGPRLRERVDAEAAAVILRRFLDGAVAVPVDPEVRQPPLESPR